MAQPIQHRGEVQIRPATDRDLPAVLALVGELDRLQYDWRVFPPRPALEEEVFDRYRRAVVGGGGDDLLIVAEEEGAVVGTAFGHILIPSAVSDEPALELSGVVVIDSHRGRGIGRALTRAAARFANERGIRIVVLKTFAQNGPALQFWQRIGFLPRMVQMYAPADRLARPGQPEG
jgi:ribosomal protein S18 acetylase RimI-like enzyme